MISTEVCEHRPPLKPINFRPIWEAAKEPTNFELQMAEMARAVERSRGDRIWQIVVDIARGTNAPMSVPHVHDKQNNRTPEGY